MILPEQTVKMLCHFCKKENEINGNQDLSKTNCFHCGKNIIGLTDSEIEKFGITKILFPQKNKIDKDELIVLLINQLEKNNDVLLWCENHFTLNVNKLKVSKVFLENKKLIKKAG